MLDLLLRVLAFGSGAFLVFSTILAAIRSFVLPRNESVLINNWVFTIIRRAFSVVAAQKRTYAGRDHIMAMYAPVGLVMLPVVWLILLSVGYTGVLWAVGEGSLLHSYILSSTSLLTLGSEKASTTIGSIFTFSEATFGLLLATLLISYLPTMYQAFTRRELVVARLELRCGTDRTATELIIWLNRTGSLADDGPQWEQWEEWFVEIEETHTSLPILSFFRSPQPGRSWVTAASIILDAAAVIISAVDQPRDPQMELCFKAGCIAINRINRYFQHSAHSEPNNLITEANPVEDPTRRDFFQTYEQLREAAMPVRADREAAWQEYQELRMRYADAVQYLARLTMSPDLKAIGGNR
ncbi:hypothetical protein SAMN02745146_0553 [Hymenobacter daecheongensis DSM 21074]|uniref:Ion channel n=1 Tax=Hymenobacter daecheongensis DSM 21074 TaxID=1121955 RepID=A0A1M6A9E4_9BACT|nr:hypothetical protein [Hymenobacter daecheongensis]SHI33057.1 hypothetical protein SAMN02745146_0553 [Hymenobacter daecheongensis DSM 21074]